MMGAERFHTLWVLLVKRADRSAHFEVERAFFLRELLQKREEGLFSFFVGLALPTSLQYTICNGIDLCIEIGVSFFLLEWDGFKQNERCCPETGISQEGGLHTSS